MMKVNESNLGYTYKKWRYVFTFKMPLEIIDY